MNIYKVTNLIDGKVYIGQTKNTPEYRFDQHFREAKCVHKKNYGIFHDALLEFGKENFEVELIETIDDKNEADKRERYWIQEYHSDNPTFGYNCDSGGFVNCTKNDITKRKIGDTTYEKWANPVTAAKMKEGLAKGTATMKTKKVRVPFTCPVCGNTIYLTTGQAQKRIVCSPQCNGKSGSWAKGVATSAIASHNKNIFRKEPVKENIIKWCIENKDIVINCPKNAISTHLSSLKQMLIEKFNIKDWRTVYICFDVKNLKSLLDVLKKTVTEYENIC